MKPIRFILWCLITGASITSTSGNANVGETSIGVSGEVVRTSCTIGAGNIELPDIKTGVFNSSDHPGALVYYTYPEVFDLQLLTQCSPGETVEFSLPALAVNNEGSAQLLGSSSGTACPSFQGRTTCMPGNDEITALTADASGVVSVPTKLTLNGANGASSGTLKFSIPVNINYK